MPKQVVYVQLALSQAQTPPQATINLHPVKFSKLHHRKLHEDSRQLSEIVSGVVTPETVPSTLLNNMLR
jgi:hypothetical protein